MYSPLDVQYLRKKERSQYCISLDVLPHSKEVVFVGATRCRIKFGSGGHGHGGSADRILLMALSGVDRLSFQPDLLRPCEP